MDKLPYHCIKQNLESRGSESDSSRRTNGNASPNRWQLGQTFRKRRNQGIIYTPGTKSQSHHGLFGRGGRAQNHRIRPTECPFSQRSLAECFGQGSERIDTQTCFIRIGARYKRIRKRPKGKSSPHLYAYKTKKLQELEALFLKKENSTSSMVTILISVQKDISLTSGNFPEKTTVLSKKTNDYRNNRFKGFCTCESFDAEKVVDFLDNFSFMLNRKAFVVLDKQVRTVTRK